MLLFLFDGNKPSWPDYFMASEWWVCNSYLELSICASLFALKRWVEPSRFEGYKVARCCACFDKEKWASRCAQTSNLRKGDSEMTRRAQLAGGRLIWLLTWACTAWFGVAGCSILCWCELILPDLALLGARFRICASPSLLHAFKPSWLSATSHHHIWTRLLTWLHGGGRAGHVAVVVVRFLPLIVVA